MTTNESPAGLRLSVIIPVYNKADSIGHCIDCLVSQTADISLFEALLIDDGSTDDSLAKCREAEKAHPFVHVIHQENQGVSSARNTGIAQARGDYLLFLDADDGLTPSTIENLIKCFDSFGAETDVVGYRMRYEYPDGQTSYHAREQYLNGTGLYPLSKNPFIAQSTINVCVRNRFADNVLFNTDLKMGEDQFYVTQNLLRKACYGYCEEAEYIYVRDKSSASSRRNNPLYAFDDMITLYSELLSIAQGNEAMHDYALNLILYNIDWRIKSDMLFPRHLRGEARNEANAQLKHILSSIPHDIYVANPYLNEYHKAYLLSEYVHQGQTCTVSYSKEAATVLFEDGSEWVTELPRVFVERSIYHNHLLRLKGRIVGPTFLYEPKPQFSLAIKSEERPLELTPSSHNYSTAKFPVTKAWSFATEVDFSSIKDKTDLLFKLAVDDREIPRFAIRLSPSIYNARIVDKMLCFPSLSLTKARNRLVAYPRGKESPLKRYLKHDIQNPSETIERLRIKRLLKSMGKKKYWMYVDLPTSQAAGNALAQMLHDLEQDDGIVRYYISNFEDSLTAQYPQLKGKVVALETDMHKCLSLRADVIVHSYLERFTFEPFGGAEYKNVGDLAINQRRIYVQHGILHAHMPWYFSYDRQMIDKEVISTSLELNALTQTYCFPETAIIDAGAPRLDRLQYSGTKTAKKIVYAPSWRSHLVAGSSQNRESIDQAMISSDFFRGLNSLIESISRSGILQKHGYELELKLHPNFKCYEHLLQLGDEGISIAPDVIDEQEYSIVITDYSSYVYDFLYAGAKVIYFFPDRAEFDAGLNHYFELEIPLENGFGPYCETPDQVVEAINAMLEGTDENESRYNEMRDGFFLHTDGRNCERLYRELKAISDAL
ncbi:MAG: glycosyltransferase [Eggerthellaceae bacterium]|nr:glycosyltransferase [Eggerthellaceae bacterium]